MGVALNVQRCNKIVESLDRKTHYGPKIKIIFFILFNTLQYKCSKQYK